MEPVVVTRSPYEGILTPEAVDFVVALDRAFGARRVELLDRRRRRRATRTGELDFLPSTSAVRGDPSWTVAPPAPDLVDRRVEVVGPAGPEAAFDALAAGAPVWIADLADATAPTWDNVVLSQLVLRDVAGAAGPAIMVRPRGWHLPECHLRIGGRAVSAALFDAGMYLFHSGRRRIERGSGPYFSLPGIESHLEARLWNDVFLFAQQRLGIPRGTVRASVVIDTVTAAFEMDEILYELRDHSAGLAAGRWDYLTSMIKNRPDVVLPERSQLAMTAPFLRAYAELLVRTCHRRGAHAIGGPAGVVPSRETVAAQRALNAIRQDKRREVGDGFDGCQVAHPGLVTTCREVFDQWLGDEPHQIVRRREDVRVTAADLLDVRAGRVTVGEVALRTTVSTALRYLAAWLGGQGTVALNGVLADAGTAELCRTQLWQWIAQGTPTDYGVPVSAGLVARMLREEISVLAETGALDDDAARRFGRARTILTGLLAERTCPPSLLLPAYQSHLTVPAHPAAVAVAA